MADGRILSIQSHVAFGYVGGKAAVFPLQCLGFDVDVINTVNFSNHSGYGHFGGSKTSADELLNLFRIMNENGVLSPSRLLTGYIPGSEALSAVAQLATDLRREQPELVYLLDPVLGDSGMLYVSPDVIPIYKSMLPLADIITPNWFEVQVLTGKELSDINSMREALRILHTEYCVPNVVISSVPLSRIHEALPTSILSDFVKDDGLNMDEYLLCVASSYRAADSQKQISACYTVHAYCIPCIPGYFSGVGDLFSALVLGHYDLSSSPPSQQKDTPLSLAVSYALTKTHAILQLTHEHAKTLPEEDRTTTDEERDTSEPIRKIRRMKGRELRIVQGQDIIRGMQQSALRRMSLWEGFWD